MKLTLSTVSIVDAGCFSVLLDQSGFPLIVTCERTFEDVRPVIPAGIFTCKRRMYHHGGYMTHEVTGLDGHSDVLFHRGNTEMDSLACVLTGLYFGMLEGKPAVLNAQAGFDRYWATVGLLDEYELVVTGR